MTDMAPSALLGDMIYVYQPVISVIIAGDGGAGCQLVEAVEIDFSKSCGNETGPFVHSIRSRIFRVLIFRRSDEAS